MADRPRPVKVLHLISTLDVGGAEQNLFRLVASMDRDTFVNEVVCMTVPGPMGSRIEDAGIFVHTLKMRKGSPELSAVLKLRFIASLYRPDVIQCWMYHANLMGMALMHPRKVLWNIRCSDMDMARYGHLYRLTILAGARLSRIPRAVVVNSQEGKSVHERLGYHPREWIVIPNGFNTEIFKPDSAARISTRKSLGIPENALVIGLVCRYDPMKDHARFFRAAQDFSEHHPGTFFVLAGRGVDRANPDIKKLLPDGDFAKRVHLLGERHDIEKIYPSFDIMTSSSAWGEGFPNAIAEAMACGIPCVTTDVGDSGTLIGDTGILVKRQSPEDLCRAWDTIARMDPAERLSMGTNARERIRLHYTQEKTTESYQQEYLKIAHPVRSPAS